MRRDNTFQRIENTVVTRRVQDMNKIQKAVIDLLKYRSEYKPENFKKSNPWYEKGDETAPFFSEGFLYPLLENKDFARSVLHYVKEVARAAGFSDVEIYNIQGKS
jgi:hypothetical protein